MPDIEDSDPPEFIKYVNRKVTLDMLSTAELVQELVDRQSLLVITAKRQVPRSAYTQKDFYSALHAIMACDLGTQLIKMEVVGEEIVQNKYDLEFSATIVVLRTLEEERPI